MKKKGICASDDGVSSAFRSACFCGGAEGI